MMPIRLVKGLKKLQELQRGATYDCKSSKVQTPIPKQTQNLQSEANRRAIDFESFRELKSFV